MYKQQKKLLVKITAKSQGKGLSLRSLTGRKTTLKNQPKTHKTISDFWEVRNADITAVSNMQL